MKKSILRDVAPVLTAILIINQAVFLFSLNADAQTSLITNTTDSTAVNTTNTSATLNTTSGTTNNSSYSTTDTSTTNNTTSSYVEPTTTTSDTTTSVTNTDSTKSITTTTDNITTNSTATPNIVSTTDSNITTSQTPIKTTDEPSTTQSFYISFVENLISPFSGDQPITVYTSQEADNVYISLSGAGQGRLTGFKKDSLHYYFIWHTKNFPDGQYKVIAAATKGTEYVSKSFTTEVKNNTVAETTATAVEIKIPLENISTETKATTAAADTTMKTTAASAPLAATSQEMVEPTAIKPISSEIKPPTTDTAIRQTSIITEGAEKTSIISESAENTATTATETNNSEIKQIIAAKTISLECREAGATSMSACEILTREKYLPAECVKQDIITKEDCQKFISQEYGRPEKCKNLDETGCQKLEKEIILSDFIERNILTKANEEIKNIVGKNIEIKNTSNHEQEIIIKQTAGQPEEIIKTFEAVKNILPLAKTNESLGLMVLGTKENENEPPTAVSAVLLLDNDGDGLTDDMEKRLGTNPNAADSDNDGFSDGGEIANGYNPLGTGSSEKNLSPIEKAIIKKSDLEQPKSSGETDSENLKINKVEGIKTANQAEAEVIKIQGRAKPNEMVSLFIYSAMPIVITVKANANGNWVYELDKTLIDGKHEAYVVINDEEGKITSKSAPFSFFIKEAKAVDQDSYLQTEIVATDLVNTMIYWYIAAGLILIALGISFYFLFSRKIT